MALILGKEQVLKNLNKEIRRIRGSTRGGLLAAANFIRLKSQQTTPVDTGHLRASHYVSEGVLGSRLVAEVGTTAKYSVFVHENLGANFRVGRAKFLQYAIQENARKIIDIIASRARIR